MIINFTSCIANGAKK